MPLRRGLNLTGAVLAGLAALVLVGRFAGIHRLVTIIPDGAPMAFTTALAFLSCGLAFLAVAKGWRRTAGALGLAAGLLGLGTLVLYASAESLGWQRFIYNPQRPVVAAGVGFDGRMSPNTAGSFVLLGVMLTMMARGVWRPRILTVLAAVLLAVAGMALVGYLTGLRGAVSWWRYTGMAVHTASAFLIAGSAVMLWVIRLTPSEERVAVRTFPFFAIATTTLLVLSVVVMVSADEREDSARIVKHTLEVKGAIERFIGAMARLDTVTRNYALTADEYYLGRMTVHRTAVLAALDELQRHVADHPQQTERVAMLRKLAGQNFALKENQVRARREGGLDAVVAEFRAEPPEVIRELRSNTDGMMAEEDRLLAVREVTSQFNARRLNWAMGVGGALAVALLGVAFSLVSRAKGRLREANEGLERRVRERTRELQFMADAMPQLVWTTRVDYDAETFNQGWVRYTGLSEAQSAKGGWMQAVHPADAGPALATWQEMQRTGRRGGGGEYRLKRASDGQMRWHLWRAEPQHDEQGRIILWVGTSTDIHEQKLLADELERRVAARTADLTAAQAELAANNRLQRAVLDENAFSIVATRTDGVVEIFNRGAEKMLGYTAEEVVGRATPLGLHVQEEIVARAGELSRIFGRTIEPGFEVLTTLARAGEVDEREWTYVRKDGSHLSVQLSVTSLHDESGAITGFLGIAHDLTQRKAAETALRASEERFRQAFDYAGIGMAIVGLDGSWLRVNKTICEIVGYDEATLMKKTFQEITHPEDLAMDLAHVHDLLAGRLRYYNMQKRYFHRDGHTVWIRLTASLVRDASGAPVHFVSQVEDVTDRKLLEESLAVARDQALEASRMKSEFLANMSHEIRTPMNAVLGMGALLADTPLSAEQQDMVATLQGGAENLLTIINDILDFSKIEAGKLRLEPVEFDFQRVIDETVALLAPRAHAKGLELTCEFAPAGHRILLGDGGRVRQVFTNLLGNAIKFTEHGEIDVEVRAVAAPEQRLRLRTSVRDTGVGIAWEAQRRLFQPFTQEDASTTRRFGGTGLGLAISRQLVELMGGEIGFESDPGRGSTFWFELEFDRQSTPPAPDLPALPAGRRVLVVDDNATNRRITLAQLARAGVAGEAVADGAAALAQLHDAGPWDAVLLDWQMPLQSGVDLAIEIRAEAAFATLPLVMLSSAGSHLDIGAATAADFTAFLTKPVSDTQLHRCLARVLAERPRATPATGTATADATPLPCLRILLVEDNPANQRVAGMMLGRLGQQVDLATNGQRALEQLAQKTYDVVLMDCQMPVLDGYEATRRIRAGDLPGVNPRIPIIALTAYAMAGDRAKCLAAGMDDHLTKPIRASDLRAALERTGLLRPFGPTVTGPVPAAPGPAVADDTLDPELLATVRSLPGLKGPSLLPELKEMYLADEAERLARMTKLIAGREGDALAHEAHGFGGNAASFGAMKVRAAALALERAARKGEWAEAEVRLAELKSRCAELRAALDALSL